MTTTSDDPTGFVTRTVAEIARGAYRDEIGPVPDLTGTAAILALLTYEALGRLETFLADLVTRAPLASPVWQPHRDALEALVADIRKHRTLLYYDEEVRRAPR